MTGRPPGAARLPRDARARERLREAQRQEAEALAGVCAAQDSLDKARAKHEAVLAAATAMVDRAQTAVDAAQAALVAVSGVERAAMLLGMDIAGLRKVVGGRNGRRREA